MKKYIYYTVECVVSGFYSLVLLLLSGGFNGLADAVEDHGALSNLNWFIDVEKYWWSFLGFTYIVKDLPHLAKVMWGLFIVLSFIVINRSRLQLYLFEYHYLIPVSILSVLSWWIGFLIVYKLIF